MNQQINLDLLGMAKHISVYDYFYIKVVIKEHCMLGHIWIYDYQPTNLLDIFEHKFWLKDLHNILYCLLDSNQQLQLH